MISERCLASSYPEDVAETVASAAVPDRMVKIEMEAAEALANLSRPVERGNSGHLIGKMAGKAKRGRRQVKCESPSSTAASYPADSAPSCSDLAQVSMMIYLVPSFPLDDCIDSSVTIYTYSLQARDIAIGVAKKLITR